MMTNSVYGAVEGRVLEAGGDTGAGRRGTDSGRSLRGDWCQWSILFQTRGWNRCGRILVRFGSHGYRPVITRYMPTGRALGRKRPV